MTGLVLVQVAVGGGGSGLVVVWLALAVLRRLGVDLRERAAHPRIRRQSYDLIGGPAVLVYRRVPLHELVARANRGPFALVLVELPLIPDPRRKES